MKGIKKWARQTIGEYEQVHPLDDLKEHDLANVGCWCRPRVDGLVVVHNSLDRREDYERSIN